MHKSTLLKCLGAVGPQEGPLSCDSLRKRKGLRAANQSLTQEEQLGSYRKQPNYVTVIPGFAFFSHLTDFNDYVITENFTTNTEIPSGGHIGD